MALGVGIGKRIKKSLKNAIRINSTQGQNHSGSKLLAKGAFTDLTNEWQLHWSFSDSGALLEFQHTSCVNEIVQSIAYEDILEISIESVDIHSADDTGNDKEPRKLLVLVYPVDESIFASLIPLPTQFNSSAAEQIILTWYSQRQNCAAIHAGDDNTASPASKVLWRGKERLDDGRMIVWIVSAKELVYCHSDSVFNLVPLCHIGDLLYEPEDGSLGITFVSYEATGSASLAIEAYRPGASGHSPVVKREVLLPRFGDEMEFREFSLHWRQQMQLKSIEDALNGFIGGANNDGNDDVDYLYREAVSLRRTAAATVSSAAATTSDLSDFKSLVADCLQNISILNDCDSDDRDDPMVAGEPVVAETGRGKTLTRADSMRRFLARGRLYSTSSSLQNNLSNIRNLSSNGNDQRIVTPPSSTKLTATPEESLSEVGWCGTPEPPSPVRKHLQTAPDAKSESPDLPTTPPRHDASLDNGSAELAKNELHLLCTALHSYNAQGPAEMTFEAKDLVRVLRKDESGWWYGLRLKPAVQSQQQEGNSAAEQLDQTERQADQQQERRSGRWVVVGEGWCPSNFLKVLMISEQAEY